MIAAIIAGALASLLIAFVFAACILAARADAAADRFGVDGGEV